MRYCVRQILDGVGRVLLPWMEQTVPKELVDGRQRQTRHGSGHGLRTDHVQEGREEGRRVQMVKVLGLCENGRLSFVKIKIA